MGEDPGVDPFNERQPRRHALDKRLLGGRFRFASNSEALLRLVEAAYAGLPPHRLSTASEFLIELDLLPPRDVPYVPEPPQMRMHSGAGVLCGVIDDSNYAVLSPREHRALIAVSEDMLEHPYHLRYELIEFAVFVLAARGMGLVPLHGACVGQHGRGVLLLGASGAGKSTLALHCLLHGLDFLAEDSVFVEPEGLFATGIANYLHLRPDVLHRFDGGTRSWIASSPTIRRRSGVKKFEVDIRHGRGRLASAPLGLTGAIFISAESARDGAPLLERLSEQETAACLAADQPYAAGQPGWHLFVQRLMQVGVHRLRRGRTPESSLSAVLQLLG
ncbi:serine kinase [Pseudoxanthomonas sp. UTMC 1351]|uniref:serine kinase n=1 Tax=Pseudoxanthomonas sp. UTMC 1351 TaxID=2695853 RepID=UPI0034CDC95B